MFFEQIDRMIGRDADLILTIRKTDDGTLTVAAHTRMNGVEDEARHYIAPFTASGTPQELDTGFIPALAEPAVKTQGLLTNLKQYEKQLETARANSKAEKERKNKEAKEAKERKEKCDKYRKKADEQTAAGKYADALTNLRQARLHATEEEKKKIDAPDPHRTGQSESGNPVRSGDAAAGTISFTTPPAACPCRPSGSLRSLLRGGGRRRSLRRVRRFPGRMPGERIPLPEYGPGHIILNLNLL